MVAKYRSVLSIPGCARVFTTALIGRLPQGMSLLAILAGDREVRETAYALESVIQELIWISGPLVVAVVVAFASPSAAVLLSGACCILGTTLFVRSPLARRSLRHDDRHERAAALSNPALRVLLAPMALMGMALGAIDVGLPSLALHAGSPPSSGLLLALWSAGSLSGGMWYGSRSWRSPLAARYRVLTVATVISTAPLIAARTIPEGVVAALLAGVTIAPAFSCLYALVGRIVSPGVETEAFTWAATGQSIGRTGRQGLPKHRWRAGMSRVTTLPAPITQPVPIVTPGHTITAVASHASSSIVIGAPHSRPVRRSPASSGWEGVTRCTPGPICTSSPIDTGPESRITAPKLMNVRAPTEIW